MITRVISHDDFSVIAYIVVSQRGSFFSRVIGGFLPSVAHWGLAADSARAEKTGLVAYLGWVEEVWNSMVGSYG